MDNSTSVQVLIPPPSCYHLGDPKFYHVSGRYTTNLVTAIINILAAPFAVISNILIFAAIVSRLRTPSNLFIGCLALSDVFIGLAVQPCYITYRLLENQLRSVACFVRVIYANAWYLCYGVSFMCLAAVSYERFVAVRLQGVRYNEFFSSKRVVKYMAVIWFLNIILTSLYWTAIYQISGGLYLIMWVTCLLLPLVTNIGIVLSLRRHHRPLQSHNTIPENVRRQREWKLTKSILFIVGVYLLLNTPLLFVKIYHLVSKQDTKTYNYYSWTETLMFLNSSTNPLICCWKSREIRRGAMAILKRMTVTVTYSDENVHKNVTRYTVNTAEISLGTQ